MIWFIGRTHEWKKNTSSLLNKGPIRTFTLHYYRSKLYSCIYHRSKLYSCIYIYIYTHTSYVYFELFLSTQYFKLILHAYFSGSFTQLLHPFPVEQFAQLSVWESWETCSTTCGVGQRNRERTALWGGKVVEGCFQFSVEMLRWSRW